MEAFKPFDEEYIDDPLRRAEHRVYEELLRCDLPGLFIHEWKVDRRSAEVDFVVWIEDVALFAIQVKGGTYRYVLRETGGEWQLWKNGEWVKVPSPFRQAWSGAKGLMDALPRRRGYHTFVVTIVLFPDMEDLDPSFESDPDHGRVHVLAEERDLVDKLVAVARERGIKFPPNADVIDDDVRTITKGRARYPMGDRHERPGDEPCDAEDMQVLEADRLRVRHIEHFHYSVGPTVHLHFEGALSPEIIAALGDILGNGRDRPSNE